MIRTALATPEEPDDPFAQFEAEFMDAESSDAIETMLRSDAFETMMWDACVTRVRSLCQYFAEESDPLVRWEIDGSYQSAVMDWGPRFVPSVQSARQHRRFKSTRFKSTRFVGSPQTVGWEAATAGPVTEDRKVAVPIKAPVPSKPVRYAHLLFRRQYARVSPQKLTGLAVFIAGRRRAAVGCEWRAHLCGETGAGLSADRQVREAAGFVLAAICYRLQDAADLAWKPVDSVLGSRVLSNLFVLLATLSFSLWFAQKAGVYGLAASLESVLVVFGASHGLILVGRWWRGVKPPEHKPRRAKELSAMLRAPRRRYAKGFVS